MNAISYSLFGSSSLKVAKNAWVDLYLMLDVACNLTFGFFSPFIKEFILKWDGTVVLVVRLVYDYWNK